MKEFIEYLLKQIVSKPESIEVQESNTGDIFQYLIKVDPSEMGLVIGKEGRTIRSLRALAKAKAIKDNVRINLELVDDARTQDQADAQI